MLNNRSNARRFKDEAWEGVARVATALGGARRLELVDLLVQGPRTVDAIAREVGQPVANTSQHLRVLKRAGLVETERQGTSVIYTLAPGVGEALVVLRRLAEARDAGLERLRRDWFSAAGAPDQVDRNALIAGLAAGRIALVDVRPWGEYLGGHLPGALPLPLDELDDRLDTLPTDRLIVACCRGPLCVFAAEAVRRIRASGRQAARYEGGPAEWVADGGVLAFGASA